MNRLARMAMSVVGLVALVVGIPAVLVRFVGRPLPQAWPSLDEVRVALEDGWSPDERFVLGVLAIVVWVLWAQLLRHVVGQLVAQWRVRAGGEPSPEEVTTRGLAPRLARWLVAGLMASAPIIVARPGLAAGQPRIPVVLTEVGALDVPLAAAAHTAPPPTQRMGLVEEAAPAYVVRTWDEHRDCLWNIAERYLDDGLRWGELLELNATASQPSGRSLADDPQHWVYPGMELRLPADATGVDLAAPAEPAPEPESSATTPVPAPPPSSVRTVPAPAPSPPTSLSSVPAAPVAPAAGPTPPTSAPIEAPTATERPAGRGSGTQVPDPIPLGGNIMRLAAALGLGLPLFAAGGVALRLNRRRRAQVARHCPGRDVPRPDRA
ncbi:MAG: LysM peptidoglycan-binding domain-containing protein [Actinobacteria bacterium]|nr:LysM peptidoglycan-binding domain-containing protein [Actinomycetota bacterium]